MGADQRTTHSITRVWHMHAGTISPRWLPTRVSSAAAGSGLCRVPAPGLAPSGACPLCRASIAARCALVYAISRTPPRGIPAGQGLACL